MAAKSLVKGWVLNRTEALKRGAESFETEGREN